jgi:alpha-1,6-mannosyltransferase
MHLVDTTMFYAPRSGGVRSYLEAKHRWLGRYTSHRHSLVVPGERLGVDGDIYRIPAPLLPFGHGYRFPLRTTPLAACLASLHPDVIEAGDPYVPAWAALDAGQRLGIPVLGFYHSDIIRLIATRTGAWASAALRRYVHALYRHFDLVLAPSEVMAQRLSECGISKVEVQPLGVDIERFHPDRRDPGLKRRLGLDDDTRLLMFVGRYAREKNITELVQAIELLGAPYHLLLVGPEMPPRLGARVSVRSSYLEHDQVSLLMASVDAFVHAGDRETFGLVVLEAMASGIPVVGVDAGGVAELVQPGTGVLARSARARDLAEAVQTLFAVGAPGLGARARRAVEARWGWDQSLHGLLSIYSALTGQAPEPVLAHGPR